MTAPIVRNPNVTLPVLMDELGEKFDGATALIASGETLSYRMLAERANRYARWALHHAAGAGAVVGLMMANCPDYLAIWLGITRCGGTVALLNTQLIGDSLSHAINVAAPTHIIVGAELAAALAAVRSRFSRSVQCWAHGAGPHELARIDIAIESATGGRLASSECALPSINDRALYLYTSGTTGRPKAANVSHHRLMQWSYWFAGMLDTRKGDCMYNCLPMYHSVGGIVAIGALLVNGGSVVLARRFSAQLFWDDIAKWDCTLFQYIGELCRFLVQSEPSASPPEHRIRLCCGNGLRGDVWEIFQQRFRIPQILEFYAATEANFSLYNCEGKPGSVGRIPAFLRHRFPVALVRLDIETEEPVRGAAGFCALCGVNEAGEAICKISVNASDAGGRFEGYTDNTASASKVLRNVFAEGDAWFRSGDLMRRDSAGFFYFVDRIGDSFRWHGENVSSTEVAAILCTCPGVIEALVYGVAVPGTEGRAGMAAIIASASFEFDVFERHLKERLPEYARPTFLRIFGELAITATFKPKKQELKAAGYDPSASGDQLFVKERHGATFVQIDAALFRRIQSGALRL